MKQKLALASAVVALAGGVALWRAASSAGEAVRPYGPPTAILRQACSAAAREALGRRVLVVQADPGKPRVAEIFESGRAPEGWSLYQAEAPATTSEPQRFGSRLSALAAAAGDTLDRDRGVSDTAARALALFAVKCVVVDDAGKGAVPLRVLKDAEPVLRVNAKDGGASAGADPMSLPAALDATPGRASDGWTWSDWDDRLWGGAVTVRTDRPGRFVFPYPGDGGRVTVNGAATRSVGAGGVPLLLLDLPAGSSRVDVSFTERGSGEIVAVLGAAGLFAGLIGFLLAIRSTPVEPVAE